MKNIIVLFEVTPTKEGKEKYLELAGQLRPLLEDAKGFIKAERFTSLNEEGKLLSLNVWENEEALNEWRNNVHHRLSQKQGREKLFLSYKITVCESLRQYDDKERQQAPKDSNEYFGK